MFELAGNLIAGLFNIGGKFIEDKDKKNEFAFKILEMADKLSHKMLETKTYPWVDALVKLAYAADAIMMKLLRPVGSAVLTGIVIYCDMNGIELSATVQALGAAAFPAWMASRHVNKQQKIKHRKYAIQMDDDYDN